MLPFPYIVLYHNPKHPFYHCPHCPTITPNTHAPKHNCPHYCSTLGPVIEVNEEEWVSDSDDEAPTQDPKFYNNNKDVTNLTKVRDQGLFKPRFRYLFLDLVLDLDLFVNLFLVYF